MKKLIIIAGNFAPNMVMGHKERGVKYQQAQGKVTDVIKDLNK